jgi:hypothetical protein
VWPRCSGIDGEQYVFGPSPRSALGDNYADQVIRDLEVVQTCRPAETNLRIYAGKVISETYRFIPGKGAWDFFWGPKTTHLEPGAGEGEGRDGHDWEELKSASDGDLGSLAEWEDDMVLLDTPSRGRCRQQTPLNDKTAAPLIGLRHNRRPLGACVVSPEVGDILNRAVWGDKASALSSSTVSKPPPTSPPSSGLQFLKHPCNVNDARFYVVTTSHVLKNKDDPINKAAAQLNTPLDLMLEQLKTGTLVLSRQPTAERATVPLDDSDESLQFFRDIFSPVSDDTCAVSVDINTAGTGSVTVYGFEASVNLMDVISPTTARTLKTRCNMPSRESSTLVFRSAHNANAFAELEGMHQPAWAMGGTASDPDCVGPAQMVLMSLAPNSLSVAPLQCTLNDILRLVGMKDDGVSRYFTLTASFQLANRTGSRNALWFIPQASHTATLRLVFEPASESLAGFGSNMLNTVRDFTRLADLDVTEPQIITKRTWEQAVDGSDSPPTSKSELGFMANIKFGAKSTSPILQTALVIKQHSVMVAGSFVGKDPGLTPAKLLDFVAETFLGKMKVPLTRFFPSAILEELQQLAKPVGQVIQGLEGFLLYTSSMPFSSSPQLAGELEPCGMRARVLCSHDGPRANQRGRAVAVRQVVKMDVQSSLPSPRRSTSLVASA